MKTESLQSDIAVEIITIGDELLIGQVIDTNSAWMAQELNKIGLKVKYISTVSDRENEIIQAIRLAEKRAGIILITGGLGPTKDDITKVTLCKYFNCDLRIDEDALRNVTRLFQARGREVTEINRKQAEVPSKCVALNNQFGTAPGMLFEENNIILCSMPGVPYEMKGIMSADVIPYLKKKFKLPAIVHETILTQGIGESFLSELIAPWEDNLPSHIRLAYLPSAGILRLRLSASGFAEQILRSEISSEIKKLELIAGKYIFGKNSDTLEKLLGDVLREKQSTISTAESCTGGYIAHRLTSVPGSSDYYTGSVIAYDNRIKIHDLGIDENLIQMHGAVSEEVVLEMAKAVREKFKTDYSIATSGIAGPSGATDDKPLGTVWIALTGPDLIFTRKLQLGTERFGVIQNTALYSFHLLLRSILGKSV